MKRHLRIEKLTLKELFAYVKRHELAIPEFQRGYVWKEKQVRDLFDSLVRGYPIGSFIVWRTNEKIGQRHLFNVEARDKVKGEKYFLLDGQQRLLTLFYLCHPEYFKKLKPKFEEIYEGTESKLIEFEHFSIKEKSKQWSLSYALDTDCGFQKEKFFKKMEGYKFPVVEAFFDDYTSAVKIFERLNQAGTKISTEAIFLSETWNKETQLGKILRDWRTTHDGSLATKFDSIIFIHALAAIIQLEGIGSGKDDYDPKDVGISVTYLKQIAQHIRKDGGGEYQKVFRKTLDAVGMAAEFLEKELKIRSVGDLPSQTIFTILSIYFYYADWPTKSRRRELKKWFWRSSFGKRYVGSSYTEHVASDPYRMKMLAKYGEGLRVPTVELDRWELQETNLHTGRATLRNALKLMLWNRPALWVDGKPVEHKVLGKHKTKKEDDHFYPYDLLAKNKIGQEINSMLNICFLPKTENASKGKKLPSVWIDKLIKELELDDRDIRKFFKSQLLPFKSLSDLENKDWKYLSGDEANIDGVQKRAFERYFKKFLRKRFELIEKEFNRLQWGQ